MLFTKKTWKDRKTEYPNRRALAKEDGSRELVTVSREEGVISEEGDAFSAENMNDLETRVQNAIGSGDIPEELGADIVAAISKLNSKLLDFAWKNGVFSGNWEGGVSFAENKNTAIKRIIGTITHTSTTAPKWGELVCKIQDYYNERAVVIMSYSEMGKVYDTFVITTNGEIRCYGNDKSQMTELNEKIFIQTTF